ncbi:MAG: hypothetical protein HYS25_16875 [Ignavibacteriales bacterium]|nr:hypothetical protein [Ignavibacteriales bacterium]
MIKILRTILVFAVFILFSNISAQIKIKSLSVQNNFNDSTLFGDTSKRKNLKLIDGWKVFTEKEPSKKIKTTLPAVFEGTDVLVFETTLNFSKNDLADNIYKLALNGANHSIEILVNGYNVYKISSGEIPFEIELPRDLLKFSSANRITIKVNSKLSSDKTIPTSQRFLFPRNNNGIIREVYLEKFPAVNINGMNFTYKVNDALSNADCSLSVTIDNLKLLKKFFQTQEQMKLHVTLTPKNFSGSSLNFDFLVAVNHNDEYRNRFHINVVNPVLWSPETPNIYELKAELLYGNQLLDVTEQPVSFYRLKFSPENSSLNNIPFSLKGTTYFINESVNFNTSSYEKIKNDLLLAKNAGFNSVRFSKSYPNPYAVKLCSELGLFALVELPLNSVPEEILLQDEFKLKAANRFKEMIQKYSQYSTSVIYGTGSSYLSNSSITSDFISYLLRNSSSGSQTFYASFIGFQKNEIEGIDLYGSEIFSTDAEELAGILEQTFVNNSYGNIFLSEVSYPNYHGSSSGYLVENSSESQARYFESIIDFSHKNKLGGFFLNTLFDYSGDYISLYAGYSDHNLYRLGILSANPNVNSISYKVVESKLNNHGKATIPIGTAKDENKLIFILIALGLSALMALLINTKRKFREDCSRALFRPYNFYADVRDQRILSGIHAIILMFVEAGSISLLFTIFLYYLRTNILFEKILISFGEEGLIKNISYLAWNPEKCFIYLFVILLIKTVALALIIKAASFFIKTRVNFVSIFYTVIWALLPFAILLPFELVFYKVLSAGGFNTAITIFLLVFGLWILNRILKGIHVIFDIKAFPVYLYSILIFIVAGGGFLLYFQLTNSTLYYIVNSIKQYQLMSF